MNHNVEGRSVPLPPVSVTVSAIRQGDWSLHRQGEIDQARHRKKVRDAIRNNLPEIISEEGIITADDGKVVKVPIRGLELPRFRYNPDKRDHIGQGSGGSKVGDIIGHAEKQGAGKGKGAGNEPGVDYYETELTIEELRELVFQDLGLPNLKPKAHNELESPDVKVADIRRSGPLSRVDWRRTLREALIRKARAGQKPKLTGIRQEDLRFRSFDPTVRRESNAVVLAMRDVSASMGEFEKYISRSLYAWMVQFLRTKYTNVSIVFITHHTQAKEVDENAFFYLGESGGTRISSAFALALEIIKKRFDPNKWNIYPFHISDGDNWGQGDNERCLELVSELLEISNLVGYTEIHQGRSDAAPSTLMGVFSKIQDHNFVPVTIGKKEDVYPALKSFFPGDLSAVGERRV